MKHLAKRLRASLAERGQAISHAQALELVAQQFGFRNWNTAVAAAPATGMAPETTAESRRNSLSFAPGQRVEGRYMGQDVSGEIRSARLLSGNRHWRLEIRLDSPVDVVTFDSFSAWRHQIACTVDMDGRSTAARSDGVPHMVIARTDPA